jgi:hypothetical protein
MEAVVDAQSALNFTVIAFNKVVDIIGGGKFESRELG